MERPSTKTNIGSIQRPIALFSGPVKTEENYAQLKVKELYNNLCKANLQAITKKTQGMNACTFHDKSKLICQLSTVQKVAMAEVKD